MKNYIYKMEKLIKNIIVSKQFTSSCRDSLLWLFGEWFGERCCDNALYLANYIAENHPEIHLYWSSKKEADLSALDSRICRITFGSKEALKIYKRAGAVFMIQGLNDFSEQAYNYFGGAVCVNLWHGVMWKHIGYDSADLNTAHLAYYKFRDRLVGADKTHYIALSDEYARICGSAWGAKPEQIIKTGYPRNYIFYHPEKIASAKKQMLDILRKETRIHWPEDTRIITYMPTFRDKMSNSYSIEAMSKRVEFMSWLEKNNIVILQKAHFVTTERGELENDTTQKRIISFNDVPAQILLAATDLLITDYSSCFFDFLLLDRPIIHFLYDYDYYTHQDRGLYYKKEDVTGGDCCSNEEELAERIIQNMNDPQKLHQLRQDRKKRFLTYEGPDSCENIYKAIKIMTENH